MTRIGKVVGHKSAYGFSRDEFRRFLKKLQCTHWISFQGLARLLICHRLCDLNKLSCIDLLNYTVVETIPPRATENV